MKTISDRIEIILSDSQCSTYDCIYGDAWATVILNLNNRIRDTTFQLEVIIQSELDEDFYEHMQVIRAIGV